MFKAPVPIDKVEGWPGLAEDFSHVVGFSRLGQVFLSSRGTSEFGVLHPLLAVCHEYGQFETRAEFERQVVLSSYFTEKFLQPERQAKIRDVVGPLSPEQVYVAVPSLRAPDAPPEGYRKALLWDFLAVVHEELANPD
ncbi:hypothetical protein BH09ACT5_BH09ACT5_08360 [soil metagenome]